MRQMLFGIMIKMFKNIFGSMLFGINIYVIYDLYHILISNKEFYDVIGLLWRVAWLESCISHSRKTFKFISARDNMKNERRLKLVNYFYFVGMVGWIRPRIKASKF